MMAAVRASDTKPELILRRELFRRGLRFRLHDKRLTGKPDLVFPSARVAVFVDGDFWHGRGWKERGLMSFEEQFPSNREFWVTKITRNMERDREVTMALEEAGWTVVRVLTSRVASDIVGVGDWIEAVIRAGIARRLPDRPRR